MRFSRLILLTSFFTFLFTQVEADTIRQMQYNLLYYTENGAGDCDNTTNSLSSKDQAFKTIVKYVMPDVLTVNEIGKGSNYTQRILDNVLNTDGVNYWDCISTVSNPSASITIGNGFFYDTRKLAPHSTFYVTTSVCYFNAYKMYYRSTNLAQGDTAFITFIVCHLKAGYNYTAERFDQAKQLMNRLVGIGRADNYVLSGDFNVYNASTEDAYQHFVHHTNPLVRFYDPINQEGDWYNNPNYADVFTQSTHSESNGCHSGGGMDNRFDFILVSDFIMNGHNKVRCIPETYRAIGQDGNRHNHSIIDPTNTAVPQYIANALYTMSDHLPVVMDYAIDATLTIPENPTELSIGVVNPVGSQLVVYPHCDHAAPLTFRLYTIDGKLIHEEIQYVENGTSCLTLRFPYPSAIYILRITDDQQRSSFHKIVKP